MKKEPRLVARRFFSGLLCFFNPCRYGGSNRIHSVLGARKTAEQQQQQQLTLMQQDWPDV
jgi:hypothetical protein